MFPQWAWTSLTLPPRHFNWRVRGNALHWAFEERGTLERGYDLVIATSMVDLSTLRGLVPALGFIPTVLYFHENQFAYPENPRQSSLLEAQMVSIYAAIAADRLLFNSAYNAQSFCDGVTSLLDRLPDFVPVALLSSLKAKLAITPVPFDLPHEEKIEPRWPGSPRDSNDGLLRIIWVGRFEHDKGPESLLAIADELLRRGVRFELALIGQEFRRAPGPFKQLTACHAPRIVHSGYVDSPSEYRALLAAGDFVLSTALHEFQGLAVMEAVAAGCQPLVPDRLAYRDFYPLKHRYPSVLDNPGLEAEGAVECLLAQKTQLDRAKPIDMSAYTCSALKAKYAVEFSNVIGARAQ